MRMLNPIAACLTALAMLMLSPALAEEPFGIGLEGFPYPYPVHMFVIPAAVERQDGAPLNMAYMDVPPEGKANGRTALLLHGRNFPSSYWRPTIEALAANGYRVVVPDQIGFGKSSKPLADLHFDQLARNTAGLLDALGIGKVDIVRIRWAACSPHASPAPTRSGSSKLVLAAPIGLEDYRLYVPPVPNEKLIEQEMKVTPDGYRRWLMTAYELTLPPEALDPYVEARTRVAGAADYPRWLAAYVNSYQMIWREPVAGEIPLLELPVLFVMGENDHVAPGRDFAPEALRGKMGHNVELAQALASKMPQASVEVFDGIGHLIPLEAPQRFNETILRFLNDGR